LDEGAGGADGGREKAGIPLQCGQPAGSGRQRFKTPAEVAMDIIDTIKEQIEKNTVLLYMKGSPNAPQCGFSARASQVVMACGEKFAFVDILQNPEVRASLPKYANWPTFPQLWVGGELVGGSDIMAELFDKGELQTLIKAAVGNADA